MTAKPRRVAIMFANPHSGRTQRQFFRSLEALESAGVRVLSVRFDLKKEAIKEAIAQNRDQHIDVIIACGGDGTMGSVVDAIVGEDALMGIIPAGTSNNFARSLGIPVDGRQAAAVIASGRETRIDVGEVNGHYFVHGAIMGLNVNFARHAQRLRGFLGRLSYPIASLIAFRERRLFRVEITPAEGEPRTLEAYQVAILNSAHFGGPFPLDAPGTGVKTHRLRVLILTDLRLRRIIGGLPKIFFQRHLGLPGTTSFGVECARLETEKPEAITLDGEIKTGTPAEIRVLPDALRVIVPN